MTFYSLTLIFSHSLYIWMDLPSRRFWTVLLHPVSLLLRALQDSASCILCPRLTWKLWLQRIVAENPQCPESILCWVWQTVELPPLFLLGKDSWSYHEWNAIAINISPPYRFVRNYQLMGKKHKTLCYSSVCQFTENKQFNATIASSCFYQLLQIMGFSLCEQSGFLAISTLA